jgi:type II secretory pathway pseudopilin PulG
MTLVSRPEKVRAGEGSESSRPKCRLRAAFQRNRSESGDTLIEVLIALVVLALAALALIIAFSSSVSASADHRQLASAEIALGTASQQAIANIESTLSYFDSCAPVPTYTSNVTLVPGIADYTAEVSNVEWWDSNTGQFETSAYYQGQSAGATSCNTDVPQEVTVTVSYTNGSTVRTYQNSFVVSYPLTSSSEASDAGAAASLDFVQTPASSQVALPLASPPEVSVVDGANGSGNVVATDLSPVILSIYSGPSGAVLSNCVGNEVNGLVTFTGCALNKSGTYVLQASETGLTSATSSPFTVGGATPPAIVFTTEPQGGAAGGLLSKQPVLTVQSPLGTTDTAFTGTLTLTASGGVLSSNCATVSIVKGVQSGSLSCTFGGTYAYNSSNGLYKAPPYTLTATGTGVTSATSTPFQLDGTGPAAVMAFSTEPTGAASSSSPSAVFPTQPIVTIEDAYGNQVTTFSGTLTMTISSGGSTGCSQSNSNGVVSFSGCHGSKYGTGFYMTVAYGSLPSVQSTVFNVTRAASYLTFTQEPVAGASGSSLVQQPIVTVYDSTGSVVTATTTNITLVSSGGTLSLCSNLTPSSGVINVETCAFSGLVGTNYTMTASMAGGVTSAVSSSFTPTGPGRASELVFTTEPVAGASGSAFTTQPVIAIEDSAGNVVTSEATLGISLSSNGGTLASCADENSVSGVIYIADCTFAGVINTASPQYELTAVALNATGIANATSSNFTPNAPGPASQILLTGCSSSLMWNTSCTLSATVEDSYGNIEVADNSPVAFQEVSGVNGLVSGLANMTASGGVASDTVTGAALGTGSVEAIQGAIYSNGQAITVVGATQTVAFYSGSSSGATVITSATTPFAPSGSYQLYAAGSAGGVVTYTSTSASVCTVNSATGAVTIVSGGTCTVTAQAAAITTYAASGTTGFTLTITPISQTVTFTSTAPTNASVGGTTYTPTATSTSGLPVTITSGTTSTCTISGGVVTFVGVGTCSLDANQAGNGNYNAAIQVVQSLTVAKGAQTVTFTSTAPANASVGGTTYTPTATSTSRLPVTITSGTTSTCTVSGGVVTFVGVGTCSLDANQAGNGNYNAAIQVVQSLTVAKGAQTITFTSTAPSGASYGGATYTASATSTSGLAVTITSGTTSVCTISSNVVSFVGIGTCTLDANQAGNGNYNAATQVVQSFVVAKGAQTITFTSTAPTAAKYGGATYTASATSTSGLAVTITSGTTSVCTISSNVVSFVGVGTCTLDANQAGNALYSAASQVTQGFAVAKGAQSITFASNPGFAAKGGYPYTPLATSTSGLTVTVTSATTSTCTIASGVVSFVGTGTCTLDANQAGNGNYNAAPQATQSITVVTLVFSPGATGSSTGSPVTASAATATTTGSPILVLVSFTSTSASTACANPSAAAGGALSGVTALSVQDWGNTSRDGVCAYEATAGSTTETVRDTFTGTAPSEATIEVFQITGDSEAITFTGVGDSGGSNTSPIFNGATPGPGYMEVLFLAASSSTVTESTVPAGFTVEQGIPANSGLASGDLFGSGITWPLTATNMLNSSQYWGTITIDVNP